MTRIIVLPIVATLAGCATYERRPLELEEFSRLWPGRDIDAESVRAYAETLTSGEVTDPYDPTNGLSLAEAEAVALVFNPRLRMARAQAEVPLASAREAGWWPDPQFEAEVLRIANRGSRSQFQFDGASFDGINASGLETTPPGYRRVGGNFVDDPWVMGAGLSITIPISGRLAVEKEWAWAEYRASWRRILISEWELLTQLRSKWLEWSTTQERMQVLSGFIDQLTAVASIAERLATAGELKPTDARLLLVELQRQRTGLQVLRTQVEQQRLDLFAMLGLAPEAPVDLVPAVFLPQIDTPESQRRERLLERDPRILAVRAVYEAAEQRLRLEVRNQYPDLNLGPNYAFDQGLSQIGIGFGLSLPLWNHNRQAVAEATAERDAARMQARAQIQQVYAELARAETRLQFAAERRQMLLNNVAPLVDQQVLDTRKLLDLGEVEVLVLRDALASALETKLDILSATLAEAQAANTLQQMLAPRWITPSQAETEENNK